MAYDWSQVGFKEITNYFLYGTLTTPNDLFSESRIRSDPLTPETRIQVNQASFMETGPGRFALGSQSSLIKEFFSSDVNDNWFVKGQGYTKDQLAAILVNHGLGSKISNDAGQISYGINLRQVELSDGAGDYWERAYIWNSEAFKIADSAMFVIDTDDKRHISNYAIVPNTAIQENFDFTGGGKIAQLANSYLKPRIDPWGIGRTVNIDFVGNAPQTKDYTKTDYWLDVAKHAKHVTLGASTMATGGIGMASLTGKLWDAGVTQFLYQDKAIIYGSMRSDTLSASQLDNLPLVSPLKSYGNANGVAIVAGDSSDSLTGGSHDDILQGGKGNDRLSGGAGNDEYRYTLGDGSDTIADSDGQGSITIGGKALDGNTKASYSDGKGHQIWDSVDGQFKYTLTGSLDKGGTLAITGAGVGGSTLTVNNFKKDQLGLKLNAKSKVAFSTGGNANPINSADFASSNITSDLAELGAKTVKLFLNGPAKTGDTVKLAATGGTDLEVITGAETIPLSSDATLQLTEGQTEVTFSIWDKGAIQSDQSVTLTATLVSADAGTGTPASDTLTLNIHDDGRTDSQDPQTTRTISGDLHPIDYNPPNKTYHYDDLGNVITDGQADPGRADVLYDSAGNDLIQAGGGDDYVSAYRGGDDVIDAGAGDDQADGGDGNDHILGGAGRDVLRGQGGNDALEGGADADIVYGHEGNDTLYGDDKIALADAITQGATGSGATGQGDFLQGMDGNDIAIGSARADLLAGGAGDDVLAAGQGDDFITGDSTYDAFTKDWNVSVQVNNGVTTYTVNGASMEESDGGADVIHAGAGNDGVLAGGGDDFVMAEDGNDKVWGEAGNDAIMGGDGDDQLNGDNGIQFLAESLHGDDFIDGGAGNDSIFGEGGNDNLFGGAGSDEIYGDSVDLSQGYDDYIDGEDGNDTLGGGGGADVIHGGTGDDLMAGDSDDTPVDQQGDDTLYGEDGNDTIMAYRGDDLLDGGLGDDQMFGGLGQDQLTGGDGNDILAGDDGGSNPDAGDADYMDGGAGNDTLFGQGGDDVMYGGDGTDTLQGGQGADLLFGDAGNDVLFGEEGADMLSGDAGADQLQGGADDDVLSGGDDNDILLGDDGNDILAGDAGDDQLQGGTGDDVLDGGDGNNTLFGEDGNDVLTAGAGNDYLIGGTGDDLLSGGDGNDVYFYNLGDGVDHISDSGGTDWVVLGGGITSSAVRLDVGSLKLVFSDGGELHLDDFDPANPMAGSVEYFQFSDGTVMSRQQLIQTLGFKIEGTPNSDDLVGTALNDTIHAYGSDDTVSAGAGNDTIDLGAGNDWADAGDGNDAVTAGDGADAVFGGNGDDVIDGGSGDDSLYGEAGADHLLGGIGDDQLSGGAGSDILEGGDGNDIYQFGVGDGQDVAIDTAGTNAVQLTGGLTQSQITLRRQDTNLVIAITGTTDQLTVKDWFATSNAGWSLVLGDGKELDRAAVEAALVTNQAPVVNEDAVALKEDSVLQASGNALSNDRDPEGRTLRVTNAGTMNGTYGTLTLNANGAFTYVLNNAGAAVQALAAGQTVTERFGYTATDDDPAGAASASSSIVVTIGGANDAPVAAADAAWTTEDSIVSASGNVLANDRDVDTGTVLRIGAPGVFTGTYGTLSLGADDAYVYTLNNNATAVQSLGRDKQVTDHFSYTVSDGITSATSSLDVTVSGTNDAPIVAIELPDQNASPSKSYSWQVPTGSFVDIDAGDVLTYRATLADGSALPSWLAFDATTRTFSGRVPRDATGYLDIQVTVNDGSPANSEVDTSSASDIFRLAFDGSVTGGGGGGTKGNEGVGNGVDLPPPGQDTNFNDGDGTSPGSPGAKGGNGQGKGRLQKHADLSTQTVATAAAVTIAHGKAASILAGQKGHGNGATNSRSGAQHDSPVDDTAARGPSPTFTLSGETLQAGGASHAATSDSTTSGTSDATSRPAGYSAQRGNGTTADAEDAVFARWAQLDARLATHFAMADDSSLGSSDKETPFANAAGMLGAGSSIAADKVSLGGMANRLASFRGLQEGFSRLPEQ
jgi:VCBS repeat-containing protein